MEKNNNFIFINIINVNKSKSYDKIKTMVKKIKLYPPLYRPLAHTHNHTHTICMYYDIFIYTSLVSVQ